MHPSSSQCVAQRGEQRSLVTPKPPLFRRTYAHRQERLATNAQAVCEPHGSKPTKHSASPLCLHCRSGTL